MLELLGDEPIRAGAECLITSCSNNSPAHRARGFAFDYAADDGGAGSWRVEGFSAPGHSSHISPSTLPRNTASFCIDDEFQ